MTPEQAMTKILKAPFPWFGGKSRCADEVWTRFGDVQNFVEPFFGSGAVLLARPTEPGIETINDKDGLVANFWRATAAAPDEVAQFADQPVNEVDLHARHLWLVNRMDAMTDRLMGDPDYYDAKIAGWWVWGLCCWIGSGWCSGKGPWKIGKDSEGYDVITKAEGGNGVNRQLPRLSCAGQGVNRQLPHLGDAGHGVSRKRPHLGNAGQGVNKDRPLADWFGALAKRLDGVRVCCGDWSRICTRVPTEHCGITGVFLDPPYSDAAGRAENLYRSDCLSVAHDVRAWCKANADNPMLRIALCGYDGEHGHDLPGWSEFLWKAKGGYAGQAAGENLNAKRERIWFSPHCLQPHPELF